MSPLPRLLTPPRRRLFLRLLMIAILQALTAAATTLLIQAVFDRLQRLDTATLQLGVALIGTALIGGWLRLRERVEAERLGQDYVHQLRLHLYRHLGRLSPRLLQRRGRGGMLLRFVGDLTALRQWLSLGLARLTVAGVVACGALATLAWLDPLLVAIGTAFLAASTLLAYSLGTAMENASRQARRQRARLANNLAEKSATMAVVQAFGQLRRERRRVERQSLELQQAMLTRAWAVGRLRAVAEGSGALASAAILLAGVWRVSEGESTAGTVAAAMTVTGLLSAYLRDLGRVHEYWLGARVAREKIEEFLRLPVVVRRGRLSLAAGPGELTLEGIAVDGCLQPIRAHIHGGAKIALVGPNGAGKSTLLSVIARLLPPDEGRILLDGIDLLQVKTADLRRAVGIVSPDLPLLRGSVRRNLRYRWPGAPETEVARVKRLCRLPEILTDLPGGEDFRLSEGGANLSLGQRQRLTLARALLGQPRLLLLDEVDANLDPEASALIDQLLITHPGTVLIVTHRRQRLRHVDQIWYLEEGELRERGTPASLLAGDTQTQRLFQHSHSL